MLKGKILFSLIFIIAELIYRKEIMDDNQDNLQDDAAANAVAVAAAIAAHAFSKYVTVSKFAGLTSK
jgi:hypothetical protein